MLEINPMNDLDEYQAVLLEKVWVEQTAIRDLTSVKASA
jgi:hypothetical protein